MDKKISAHNLSGGADTQNFSHIPKLFTYPTFSHILISFSSLYR